MSEPADPSDPIDQGPAWRADLLAGVTNAILAIPQGIAFAIIAGVHPKYGLYAMIVPTVVAALVRDSPFVIAGGTNTSALVIGALIAAFAVPDVSRVEVMLLIVLMMGLIQLAFAVLRLGGIGRYVSQAVLVGFTFGAAALIGIGQLKNVLGLTYEGEVRLASEIAKLVSNLGATDGRAAGLAVVTWIIVVVCAGISRLIPGPLIAVFITGAMVAVFGWDQGSNPIPVVGEIPRELPQPTLAPVDNLHLAGEVFMPSLAIAILGIVEAISIGKALSAQARIKFHANQELAAQGLGNIAGAFTSCMPASASWTRSAINMQMGARTRWVGVVAGVAVLAIMLAFVPWAKYIPKACLGALIVWIAVKMVDPKGARRVWVWGRADAFVMLLTFAAMLFIEVQYAIYLGVFASLLLLVRRAGRLQVVEMAEAEHGRFREIELDEETGKHPVVLLQLEGDLFFGVVDELEENLDNLAARGAKAIVLRLKRAHAIDATASAALASFAQHFKKDGGRLIFCGLRPEMRTRILTSHLGEVLGAEHLLLTGDQPFRSVQRALELAKDHALAAGCDATKPLMRAVPERLEEAWSYQI